MKLAKKIFYYAQPYFPQKCNHKVHSLNSKFIKVQDQYSLLQIEGPNWILKNEKEIKKPKTTAQECSSKLPDFIGY